MGIIVFLIFVCVKQIFFNKNCSCFGCKKCSKKTSFCKKDELKEEKNKKEF